MTGQDADKVQAQMDRDLPGPDVMLRLWAFWMDQMSAPAKALADPGTTWWQMTTDNPASGLIAGGVNQLQSSLSQDPTLRTIDQMWNANPLREVVPVDWAEIARALRIVWLRSLRKPGAALAVADLNQDLWRSAVDVWQEAGQRWLGMTGASSANGSSAATDKRFAAPEWHTNPVYRTLQQVYLLASDWLLQQGDVEGMDEAEQQRINFHLRQFVDAMSPALILLSNPVALQRALETGGTRLRLAPPIWPPISRPGA
jgi:polyhydroxyalkanoate synthase